MEEVHQTQFSDDPKIREARIATVSLDPEVDNGLYISTTQAFICLLVKAFSPHAGRITNFLIPYYLHS